MTYRLSRQVELVERGGEQLLVCRSPLAVLRLNGALHALVFRAREGAISPATPAEAQVLEQLATKGFVEREIGEAVPLPVRPSISVVIPVKDRADELRRCLDSISRVEYPRELIQLIVVDDGSQDDSAAVARQCGAQVVSSGGIARGPAAARNAGAKAATGEILAFIDSDCTASENWLADLLPAFGNGLVAAVGGYVDGMCRQTAVDRYESVMSSLTLGNRERTGGSGDDTFYLPSCNLLVRRRAFMLVGGFRDEMHVGEDVDLTWRLRDNGWTIRYLPTGRIYHAHRSTLRTFMSRRFDYGTSEGTLQRLHPLRRKRLVFPPQLVLLLVLLLLAPLTVGMSLLAAAALLVSDGLLLRRRLRQRQVPLGLRELLTGRLRALGSLCYYLSYHLVRYYALPLLTASLFWPILGLLLPAALLCAARVDYVIRKPEQRFDVFIAIYALEHLAYGAGVFWGCLRRGTFASYRVVLLRQAEVAS
jgi:mycofactocin system glycosyltransferase